MNPIWFTAADLDIATRTVIGEARGENITGQVAVAFVIRNRVLFLPSWWGNTPKEVCLKPSQFSCWNLRDPNRDFIMKLSRDDSLYQGVEQTVLDVFLGIPNDPTYGATTYKVIGTKASWDSAVEGAPPKVVDHQEFWRLSPAGKLLPLSEVA
jgi:N-acetylmuramoyl-L-alanine amidase